MRPKKETVFLAKTRAMFCLLPGCGEAAEARGLCGNHYRVAWKLIDDGVTTWTKLEQHGKALAPQRHATEWFLDFVS